MKVRTVLALLAAEGWYLERTGGGRRQFRHATKPGTLTIAADAEDDLHPETLASILRQAGAEAR